MTIQQYYETHMTQAPMEIGELLEIVREEGIRSYLEVGSRWGGSLWTIARAMPEGSRIVSVDSGEGQGGNKPGQTNSLRKCIKHLRRLGYDAHVIMANSQDAGTVKVAAKFGPYDMVMIDADHSFDGVSLDWQNYSPLGRIVVLHDVAFVPPNNGRFCMPCEVPRLWSKLRPKYRHREIVDPKWNMGIGVIWR